MKPGNRRQYRTVLILAGCTIHDWPYTWQMREEHCSNVYDDLSRPRKVFLRLYSQSALTQAAADIPLHILKE